MQLVLLLKDFPTGVIYECMHEWHKFQLFLHFGGCESIKVYNEFENTFPLQYHCISVFIAKTVVINTYIVFF